MGVWIKANGGPIGVVVLGLTLAGVKTTVGWVLVVAGFVWWLTLMWRRMLLGVRRLKMCIQQRIRAGAATRRGELPQPQLVAANGRNEEDAGSADRDAAYLGDLIGRGEGLYRRVRGFRWHIERGGVDATTELQIHGLTAAAREWAIAASIVEEPPAPNAVRLPPSGHLRRLEDYVKRGLESLRV